MLDLRRIRPSMLLSGYHWRKLLKRPFDRFSRLPSETLTQDLVDYVTWPAAPDVPSALAARARDLRVLYVAPVFDYGSRRRGLSYEENNFFHPLASLGCSMAKFDFPTLLRAVGRQRLQEMLVDVAYRFQPDVTFFVLFGDEFDPRTLERMRSCSNSVLVNWFTDDHWRFDSFTRRWAPCFDLSITTDRGSIEKYGRLGLRNVMLSQWACNHRLYFDMKLPKKHDIAFIGQPHGERRRIIERLRRAGLEVECRGEGWSEGRVSQAEMVELICSSRIGLNLSNASVAARAQIKGRDFEIPGCGTALLTGNVEGLDRYFIPGEEIEVYDTVSDLVDRAQSLLADADRRESIAARGRERVLREHTFDHRFAEILVRAVPERFGHGGRSADSWLGADVPSAARRSGVTP